MPNLTSDRVYLEKYESSEYDEVHLLIIIFILTIYMSRMLP